ncbi:MAG: hypothetical protein AAFN13_13850 [Bacteroidota bacterium]
MIYHVDASYSNTIGGGYDSGLVIADSTEEFRYGGFGELTPYAVISGVSRAKVQFVTWTEFPGGLRNDTVTTRFIEPLPSEWTEVGNVKVEHARYRGRVGGVPCRLHEYEFARFEESADSLVVYDLTGRDSVLSERMAFPKGDIKATLDGSGFVERLEVEEFVTGVYPGYRTSRPLDLVDLPTVCVATYWLNPAGPERQRISDYGVFKPFWSCAGEEDC